MPATQYYPSVTQLIRPEELPDELGFVRDGLAQALERVFYRNLHIHSSRHGDQAHYTLELIIHETFGIEIPGTELLIRLNPNIAAGGTLVPLSFEYTWEILALLGPLSLDQFPETPRSWFDLIINLLGLNEKELIKEAIRVFVNDPDPIGTFIARVNTSTGNALGQVAADSDEDQYIQNLIDAIQGANLTAYGVVFDEYFGPVDLNTALRQLEDLFRKWFGYFSVDRIKQMFIPRFRVTIQDIGLAVDLPRSVLRQVDPVTKMPLVDPVTGENVASFVAVSVGSVTFDSQAGLRIDADPAVSFPESEILETGLTVAFTEAKFDFSRDSNLLEAAAEGRPNDFVGVFISEARISLPRQWFLDQQNSTAEIFGRGLLIGTGGFSGTLGLRVVGNPPLGQEPELRIRLGSEDGFSIGFRLFDIAFRQNSVLESNIRGSMRIPGFKDAAGNDVLIDLLAHIGQNGDFELAASETEGIPIRIPNVLEIQLKEAGIGRQEGDYFLAVSGALSFVDGAIGSILKGTIELERLTIWSDGRIELEGGSLTLPEGVSIQLGPVEITITAIHFGSHQQDHGGVMRKYRYFGLDGGINMNPGGVDARGDGIKFFYTVDDDAAAGKHHHSFLRIQSLAIDLIIPGDAGPDTAAVLISGYLALKQNEYEGGIALSLPQVGIAGGANMRLNPKAPAFLIDAFLELPVPIVLGPTGLGIYGFRGLIGHRYVASKSAVGLSEDARWFDYYKAPPSEGVHAAKFAGPDQTAGSRNPFSLGAGVSIATAYDAGNTFSCKLFFLLSLPNLIWLEGKANFLAERVGLTSQDPPFFAYLGFSPESIETGFGANYLLPETGEILKLDAAMQAAFFWKNPSAWYIHFGTKEEPNQGIVFTLFHAEAYLMMSASGIEAGAKSWYRLNKDLAGVVHIDLYAYQEVEGFVSFERPQIGGTAGLGGHVDVSVFGFGFHIGIHAFLSVEVPRPFLISGGIELCVGIKILFTRIEKCFGIDFTIELNSDVNTDPVIPFQHKELQERPPAKGLHIHTGRDFDLAFFGTQMPDGSHPAFTSSLLPLDTHIDIEFKKAMVPNAVANTIGGVREAPEAYIDLIPPKPVARQVRHEYSIEQIELKAWHNGMWVDYQPYEAMASPQELQHLNANRADYKLGFWQKTHPGRYNKIRLLAETEMMHLVREGIEGVNVPEQFGITSQTLFCQTKLRDSHCTHWTNTALGHVYPANQWQHHNGILFKSHHRDAPVIAFQNLYNLPHSLAVSNQGQLEILFEEPCVGVELKLFTYAAGVRVSFYEEEFRSGGVIYTFVQRIEKTRLELMTPVRYADDTRPIRKVLIEPLKGDPAKILDLVLQIDDLRRQLDENPNLMPTHRANLENQLAAKVAELEEEQAIGCVVQDFNFEMVQGLLANYREELEKCRKEEQASGFKIDVNLIPNGDFAQLNRGFKTDYRLNEIPKTGEYSITTDAAKLNRDWIGKAKVGKYFMAVNGSAKKDMVVWNVSTDVEPEQEYEFAGLLANLSGIGSSCILVRVKGNKDAKSTSMVWDTPEKAGDWKSFSVKWKSGASKRLALEILLVDPREFGNDFGLDGLTLRPRQPQVPCEHYEALIKNLELLIALLTRGYQRPIGEGRCSTLLHEVCYMTLDDYTFNIHVPGQDAVEADYQAEVEAIETTLPPIWRPDTKYLIHLKVADSVNGAAAQTFDYYIGFRTPGPIGFFPADMARDEAEIEQLNTLRAYIDYEKSYPNADGRLINAKPLFYQNARLQLHYTRRYVYHMFYDWPVYQGLPLLQGRLQVIIKDPAEDVELENPPIPGVSQIEIPETVVSWPSWDDPRIPEHIRILSNLRNPELIDPNFEGGQCWPSGGDMIRPASVITEITLDHLKPLKLYTAIFNNIYQGVSHQIHSCVFQTSRYANFADQVNSYHLQDNEGHQRDAVYRVELDLDAPALALIDDLVKGSRSSASESLAGNYPDTFDRLNEAVLGSPLKTPAESTEFNTIYNVRSGKTIAIWIRNPEPFNDPKIPLENAAASLSIMNGTSVDTSYLVLFSRDRSQMLVYHTNGEITAPELIFRFQYLEWDGTRYQPSNTVTTQSIRIGEV